MNHKLVVQLRNILPNSFWKKLGFHDWMKIYGQMVKMNIDIQSMPAEAIKNYGDVFRGVVYESIKEF